MIAGLQKMTLLDFPGKVACTLFLQGCNFRCPFCHNSDLLPHTGEKFMSQEAFLAFLESRKGLLEGVAVTGGEPTGQPELPELLQKIKAMDFSVKLDTNGTNPKMLQGLMDAHLVDYVAVDVKNSPAKYAQTVGLPQMQLDKIAESLKLLLTADVDYELRTTLVAQLHEEQDIEAMGKWLISLVPGKKPKKLFLQSFVDRDSVLFSGLCAPSTDEILRYKNTLAPYVEKVEIRGVEMQ